ncbi:hypothetical protein [Streptomyces sp. NPDC002825]
MRSCVSTASIYALAYSTCGADGGGVMDFSASVEALSPFQPDYLVRQLG